jgi:hypothetical protein
MTHWTLSLTEHEWLIAEWLANYRTTVNQKAGVKDRKMGTNRDPVEIATEGYAAEFAVCRQYNVWPELNSAPRRGGHDCTIHGHKVDVKAVPARRDHIFIPERKRDNTTVDLFVWCLVEGRRVTLLGWTTPYLLFAPEYLRQSPRADERHYMAPAGRVLSPTATEALERSSIR